MGNYKKPPIIAKSEGDTRKRGRRKHSEAQKTRAVADGLPECPENLPDRASQVFRFLAQELNALGVVGAIDELILVTCSNAVADAEEAAREVACLRSGPQNRETRAARTRAEKRGERLQALFLKCADRLGLSPRARQGLAVEPPQDAHAELMAILSKPRVSKIPMPKDKVQ